MDASTGLHKKQAQELEFATFYVGNMLIGIDIQQVQEINRHLDTTDVPHAPEFVRGVINLRGEVVTVLDLRTILNLESDQITESNRNIIVQYNNEQVGLQVDRIADVVVTNSDEMEPSPANIRGVDGRFFKGIFKLEKELMVVLDVEKALFTESELENTTVA